jgi:hypothetical protein
VPVSVPRPRCAAGLGDPFSVRHTPECRFVAHPTVSTRQPPRACSSSHARITVRGVPRHRAGPATSVDASMRRRLPEPATAPPCYRGVRARSNSSESPRPSPAVPTSALARMQSRGPDDCDAAKRSSRPGGVARRTCVSGRGLVGAPQEARSTTRTSAARGVAARDRARRRSPVTGSGCGSPRAVLIPSSGQGVGEGCGDSRGVSALPTSPSAGVDAGRVGGTRSINKAQLPERRPPARSTTPPTAEQPGRGRTVRMAKGSIRDDLLRPVS